MKKSMVIVDCYDVDVYADVVDVVVDVTAFELQACVRYLSQVYSVQMTSNDACVEHHVVP